MFYYQWIVYHIRYTNDEAATTLVTEFYNLVQGLMSIVGSWIHQAAQWNVFASVAAWIACEVTLMFCGGYIVPSLERSNPRQLGGIYSYWICEETG